MQVDHRKRSVLRRRRQAPASSCLSRVKGPDFGAASLLLPSRKSTFTPIHGSLTLPFACLRGMRISPTNMLNRSGSSSQPGSIVASHSQLLLQG